MTLDELIQINIIIMNCIISVYIILDVFSEPQEKQ